ncbi:hypothetical protein [Vibrio aquimaris]|uniref:Uncharacterized protein n=1 Tax=Vibrio aquimaris TaxID=2587862 RepID=A0A5P9CQR8_9VIBR|nr:hypothetical protein [Vibrio aquimaris]QFT28301.1 hypothetical protein FIV01_18065 [Vibrio aquimaris]
MTKYKYLQRVYERRIINASSISELIVRRRYYGGFNSNSLSIRVDNGYLTLRKYNIPDGDKRK